MAATTNLAAPPGVTLGAKTAADLMTPNPMSIRGDATVCEAVEALTNHGFSAAPVIDAAGRPIGVVSRADILFHDREEGTRTAAAVSYERADLTLGSGEHLERGLDVEGADGTLVSDIMTPAVFSVAPGTPAPNVVEEMLALKVHRLYVVEEDGTLVGVISALDILRHLRPPT
jgi:CBS domain-containing protein